MIPTFFTPRMIIREFSADDAESFFANYASNADNHKYYSDAVYTLPKVRSLIDFWSLQYREGGRIRWAIEYKENGEVIGLVSLLYNEQTMKGEVCFGIGQEYWGKGLMCEALMVVFRYCFCELQIKELIAACDIRNVNAIAVMKKCGMTFEKIIQENCSQYRHFCVYKKDNCNASDLQ